MESFTSSPRVAIVDYGLGNISALLNIYKSLEIDAIATSSVEELERATHLILPGVGSFDWSVKKLRAKGLQELLNRLVLEKHIPILGICVGLQMMTRSSQEGELQGLGWFDSRILRFWDGSENGLALPLPHMGWNEVKIIKEHPLWDSIPEKSSFYFLHSYYHPFSIECETFVIGLTDYGIEYASAVSIDNIHAVQFHHEKSHGVGIQLLKNFASL